MPIVLILGLSSDSVISYLIRYLSNKPISIVYIDQDLLGSSIVFDSNYWYLPGLDPISHDSVTAVFNRCASPNPGGIFNRQKKILNSLLLGLLDYRYSNVINRPAAMMSNTSKPYQSYLLRNFNIFFPKDICLANVYIEKVFTGLIYKSISSVRSIVHRYDLDSPNMVVEPVLFQNTIIGNNIRVHIIGEEIFSLSVEASGIDYRYSEDKRFILHSLPEHIARVCLKIAKYLGLVFCGIDLILSHKNYFFLEANPAPGYDYFEEYFAGTPISDALYRVLVLGK